MAGHLGPRVWCERANPSLPPCRPPPRQDPQLSGDSLSAKHTRPSIRTQCTAASPPARAPSPGPRRQPAGLRHSLLRGQAHARPHLPWPAASPPALLPYSSPEEPLGSYPTSSERTWPSPLISRPRLHAGTPGGRPMRPLGSFAPGSLLRPPSRPAPGASGLLVLRSGWPPDRTRGF